MDTVDHGVSISNLPSNSNPFYPIYSDPRPPNAMHPLQFAPPLQRNVGIQSTRRLPKEAASLAMSTPMRLPSTDFGGYNLANYAPMSRSQFTGSMPSSPQSNPQSTVDDNVNLHRRKRIVIEEPVEEYIHFRGSDRLAQPMPYRNDYNSPSSVSVSVFHPHMTSFSQATNFLSSSNSTPRSPDRMSSIGSIDESILSVLNAAESRAEGDSQPFTTSRAMSQEMQMDVTSQLHPNREPSPFDTKNL